MGTKLKVVLCDEHGIGGSGEYFGDNDAHLDIINVFYHEASGGKYLPRAVSTHPVLTSTAATIVVPNS